MTPRDVDAIRAGEVAYVDGLLQLRLKQLMRAMCLGFAALLLCRHGWQAALGVAVFVPLLIHRAGAGWQTLHEEISKH